MEVTARVWRRIRRDFGPEAERIREVVDLVSPSEREQAAIVLGARGDEKLLEQYVELARLDPRDLFVAAGLAERGWERRLDRELGRPREHRPGGRVPGRVLRWLFVALVVPGVVLFLLGLPLLVVDQYLDRAGRTATTHGRVTGIEHNWGGRGPEYTCTYVYTVDGGDHTGSDGCPDDTAAGTGVTVRYDPADTESSHVWSSHHVVGLIGGLGAWGVALLVLARYWWTRRRRRGTN